MRIVAANWKMNHLRADATAFMETLKAGWKPVQGVVAAVAPPFPLLPLLQGLAQGTPLRVYAQNAHAEPKGAFTGEVSMAQVMDAGACGVILGHSERRQYNGETEATLLPKLKAAAAQGLAPMLCVGETLAQRDAGETLDVLKTQLAILAGTDFPGLAVAYEPVWAIGTGRVATVDQIAEVHAFVRGELKTLLGDKGASTPILYGGSVTPDNFGEILAVPDVAGGLVGGASLDPAKFLRLLEIAAH
ncbi:MAG TPA: triose-phosphate isomerase [Holophaga sp.]|nr:triose-phosphate isomerase [Holophaga sp.]